MTSQPCAPITLKLSKTDVSISLSQVSHFLFDSTLKKEKNEYWLLVCQPPGEVNIGLNILKYSNTQKSTLKHYFP